MINFIHLDSRFDLGYLPEFADEDDPRSLRDQLDDAYAHGGGWRPFKGFVAVGDQMSIQYPGDPVMRPVAVANFRTEIIAVYEGAWVAIWSDAETFEISRMD